MNSKTPIRADLPNGVVIYARHFPGYGSPPGWEITIIDKMSRLLLDYIQTLYDDDFNLALVMTKEVKKWAAATPEAIAEANSKLNGCPYGDEHCGYLNDYGGVPTGCRHFKIHGPAFDACTFCGGDTIGWSRTWADKIQCWSCYEKTDEFKDRRWGGTYYSNKFKI